MSARVTRAHEVVVVGGGKAGVAMGRQLALQSCDVTILEAAQAPAAASRERWDSLRHGCRGPSRLLLVAACAAK